MVDFRYHALSLVAVFLALGIGIVLGVTIGDSLVSDADRNLRDSLRGDLTEAREQVRDEVAEADLREGVIEELTEPVARGTLRGRSVALVALGELPGDVGDGVEEAVEVAGGSVHSTTVLAVADDLDELARGVPARRGLRRRLAPTAGDPDATRLGGRIGRAILRGERGLSRLRDELPQRFSGSYAGRVDAVVLYRHPPPEAAGDAEDAVELRETFDAGVVNGLSPAQPLVGVEAMGTDPSQVGWYDDHALVVASVDNVDTAEGRLALVYVLVAAGGDTAKGRFGAKGSADRPLPDLSD